MQRKNEYLQSSSTIFPFTICCWSNKNTSSGDTYPYLKTNGEACYCKVLNTYSGYHIWAKVSIKIDNCPIPVPSDFSIGIWSKYNDISCILMTPNMWARANRYFVLKTKKFYLVSESTDQGRTTDAAPTISGPMTTYKNIWTLQCFRRSRLPLAILYKHFFNKCLYIKMGQPPAIFPKMYSIYLNSGVDTSTRRRISNELVRTELVKIELVTDTTDLYLIMSGKINTSPFDVSVPSCPSHMVKRV